MTARARAIGMLLGMLVATTGAAHATPLPTPAAAASDALPWLLTQPLGELDAARLKRDAENGAVAAQLDYARYLLRHDQDAAAVSWLTQANQQGDARAQYLLGMLYLRGRAVAQDFDQARYFLGKAADQSYAPAQYRLGRLLLDGPFVDPALENASPAQLQQATHHGTELLRRAAAAGYAPAAALLNEQAGATPAH